MKMPLIIPLREHYILSFPRHSSFSLPLDPPRPMWNHKSFTHGLSRWEFDGDYGWFENSKILEAPGMGANPEVQRLIVTWILFFM